MLTDKFGVGPEKIDVTGLYAISAKLFLATSGIHNNFILKSPILRHIFSDYINQNDRVWHTCSFVDIVNGL